MKIILRPSSRHGEEDLRNIIQGYINTFDDLNNDRLVVYCDNDKVVIEENEDSRQQVDDDTFRFLKEEIEREFSADFNLIEVRD